MNQRAQLAAGARLRRAPAHRRRDVPLRLTSWMPRKYTALVYCVERCALSIRHWALRPMRKPRPLNQAIASRSSRRPVRSRATSSTRASRSCDGSGSSRSTTTRCSPASRGIWPAPPDVRADAFLTHWNDPSVAALIAVRGGYGSVQLLPLLDPPHARRRTEAVHRLQRQHVAAVVADCSAASRRCTARCSNGGWRAARRIRRALVPGAAQATARAGARARWARGAAARRGAGAAVRRHDDAARRVARDAVRLRPAGRLRPVSRGRQRAAVPDRSHADAAAAERRARPRAARSCSARCAAATSRAARVTARDVDRRG